MKKIVLVATAVLLLFASTAMADSIKGKFGITARGGASYILNSEWTDEMVADSGGLDKSIKPGIGLGGGLGIMYGITDNLSVNFDVIYMQADFKATGGGEELTIGKGKTIDFALGAQWRFMPKSRFVPYIGAGVDIMVNRLDLTDEAQDGLNSVGLSVDVANTYGGHLSVGGDFFITPNIALNAEIRGLYSTKGDIKVEYGSASLAVAEYNPTNISGFIGIRFFFP
jgi:outer membrane protein